MPPGLYRHPAALCPSNVVGNADESLLILLEQHGIEAAVHAASAGCFALGYFEVTEWCLKRSNTLLAVRRAKFVHFTT